MATKTILFSSLFLVLVLVQSAYGQGSSSPDGLWEKLKKMVKDFVGSMRDIWNQMKDEIKARTTDMRDWTSEMFNAFKIKMKEWVDDMAGASDSDKEDMRNYIERLEMPPKEENRRRK